MSTLIALLLAIGFSFAPRGNCQPGELVFWEDASYRIEPSESSVICEIASQPESSLSFLAVSYNDETDEITITRWNYSVGGDVEITLLETR